MTIFKQIVFLLVISVVGELIAALTGFILPIPGSVWGIFILFALLYFRIIPLDDVNDVGEWLINNMSILFLPGAIKIIDSWDLLAENWWQIIVTIIISGCILLVTTGLFMQKIFKEE